MVLFFITTALILHCQLQCIKVSISLHPCQHSLFPGFLIEVILIGIKWGMFLSSWKFLDSSFWVMKYTAENSILLWRFAMTMSSAKKEVIDITHHKFVPDGPSGMVISCFICVILLIWPQLIGPKNGTWATGGPSVLMQKRCSQRALNHISSLSLHYSLTHWLSPFTGLKSQNLRFTGSVCPSWQEK